MSSGPTAAQIPPSSGASSGSRAALSCANAVAYGLFTARKNALGASLNPEVVAHVHDGDAQDGACAVATVLQCPALLAVLFSFLEPADLCTLALVCDAWSLVWLMALAKSCKDFSR